MEDRKALLALVWVLHPMWAQLRQLTKECLPTVEYLAGTDVGALQNARLAHVSHSRACDEPRGKKELPDLPSMPYMSLSRFQDGVVSLRASVCLERIRSDEEPPFGRRFVLDLS